MLQILCSSVRVKLLARAKLIFLRERPDDFLFCGEPCTCPETTLFSAEINAALTGP